MTIIGDPIIVVILGYRLHGQGLVVRDRGLAQIAEQAGHAHRRRSQVLASKGEAQFVQYRRLQRIMLQMWQLRILRHDTVGPSQRDRIVQLQRR